MKRLTAWITAIIMLLSIFFNTQSNISFAYEKQSSLTLSQLQSIGFDSMQPDQLKAKYSRGEISDAIIVDYYVLVKGENLAVTLSDNNFYAINPRIYGNYKVWCYGDENLVTDFIKKGLVSGVQQQSWEKDGDQLIYRYLGFNKDGLVVSNDAYSNDFTTTSDPESRNWVSDNAATSSWDGKLPDAFELGRLLYENVMNDDTVEGQHIQTTYSTYDLFKDKFSGKSDHLNGYKDYLELKYMPASDSEGVVVGRHKTDSGRTLYDTMEFKTGPYITNTTSLVFDPSVVTEDAHGNKQIIIEKDQNIVTIPLTVTTNIETSDYIQEALDYATPNLSYFVKQVNQQIEKHANEILYIEPKPVMETPEINNEHTIKSYNIELNVSDIQEGKSKTEDIIVTSYVTSRDNTLYKSTITENINIIRPGEYFVDFTIENGGKDVTDSFIHYPNLEFSPPETFEFIPNVFFSADTPRMYRWDLYKTGDSGKGFYNHSTHENASLTLTGNNVSDYIIDGKIKAKLSVLDSNNKWHESEEHTITISAKPAPSTDPIAVLKAKDQDRNSSYYELEVQVGEHVRLDGRESHQVDGGKPITVYDFDTDAVIYRNRASKGYLDVYYTSLNDSETVELTVYDEDGANSEDTVDIELVEPVVQGKIVVSQYLKEHRTALVELDYDKKPSHFEPYQIAWSILPPTGGTYYIESAINNNTSFPIQFDKAGEWTIKASVDMAAEGRPPEGYEKNYTFSTKVSIAPDQSPQGTGEASEIIIRKPSNTLIPTLRIWLDAVSIDADLIDSIDVFARYDVDYDDDLEDESFIKVTSIKGTAEYYDWDLPRDYVGKGQYYLVIKENPNQPYLRWLSNYDKSITTPIRDFVVDNIAPGMAIDLDKTKKVDILVATDFDGLDRAKLETELNDVKVELLSKYVDANILIFNNTFTEHTFIESKYSYKRYLKLYMYDCDYMYRHFTDADDDTAYVNDDYGTELKLFEWESQDAWETEVSSLPSRVGGKLTDSSYIGESTSRFRNTPDFEEEYYKYKNYSVTVSNDGLDKSTTIRMPVIFQGEEYDGGYEERTYRYYDDDYSVEVENSFRATNVLATRTNHIRPLDFAKLDTFMKANYRDDADKYIMFASNSGYSLADMDNRFKSYVEDNDIKTLARGDYKTFKYHPYDRRDVLDVTYDSNSDTVSIITDVEEFNYNPNNQKLLRLGEAESVEYDLQPGMNDKQSVIDARSSHLSNNLSGFEPYYYAHGSISPWTWNVSYEEYRRIQQASYYSGTPFQDGSNLYVFFARARRSGRNYDGGIVLSRLATNCKRLFTSISPHHVLYEDTNGKVRSLGIQIRQKTTPHNTWTNEFRVVSNQVMPFKFDDIENIYAYGDQNHSDLTNTEMYGTYVFADNKMYYFKSDGTNRGAYTTTNYVSRLGSIITLEDGSKQALDWKLPSGVGEATTIKTGYTNTWIYILYLKDRYPNYVCYDLKLNRLIKSERLPRSQGTTFVSSDIGATSAGSYRTNYWVYVETEKDWIFFNEYYGGVSGIRSSRIYPKTELKSVHWLGSKYKYAQVNPDNEVAINMTYPSNVPSGFNIYKTSFAKASDEIAASDILASSPDNKSSLDYGLLLDSIVDAYASNGDANTAYVLVGDKLESEWMYTDYENDPQGVVEFKASHDPTVHDNALGYDPDAGVRHKPMSQFNYPGLYIATGKTKDTTVNASYDKWSQWTNEQNIFAHRKPVAQSKYAYVETPQKTYLLTMLDNGSYDPDFSISRPDKGIAKHTYSIMKSGTGQWTLFDSQVEVEPGTEYTVAHQVFDVYGASSDYEMTDIEISGDMFVLSASTDPVYPNPVAPGKAIRIDAEIVTTKAIQSVVANVDGTNVILNPVSSDMMTFNYSASYTVPSNKADGNYDIVVTAIPSSGSGQVESLQMKVETPLNLTGNVDPYEVKKGQVGYVKAQTSLFANMCKVILFLGESGAVELTLSKDTIEGSVQNWTGTYTFNENHTEDVYNALFTATTENGNLETYLTTFKFIPNQKPSVSFINQIPVVVYQEDDVVLNFLLSDQDGDDLHVNVIHSSADEDNLLKDELVSLDNLNSKMYTLTLKDVSLSDHVVEITVTDPSGESASTKAMFSSAELFISGAVSHVAQWNENRIAYNRSKTNTDNAPRPQSMFWSGEQFNVSASTTSFVDGATTTCSKVSIQVVEESKVDELASNPVEKHMWTGSLWDASLMDWDDGVRTFKFTAEFSNGMVATDEVEILIDNTELYWRTHRLY